MIDLLNNFIEKTHYYITFFVRNNKIKIILIHIMMPLTGKFQLIFDIQIVLNPPEKKTEKSRPEGQTITISCKEQIGFHKIKNG